MCRSVDFPHPEGPATVPNDEPDVAESPSLDTIPEKFLGQAPEFHQGNSFAGTDKPFRVDSRRCISSAPQQPQDPTQHARLPESTQN